MERPNIDTLVFSNASKDAIKRVREIQSSSRFLMTAVELGQVVNIFAGNNALKASYSINSTDFEMMAVSMQGVSSITRKLIEDTATYAQVTARTNQERLFWKAVVYGCKLKVDKN